MEHDSLQDTILRRQGSDGISESEIAAAAWSKLLGDLPKDFYESVSYEGRAAIRQALDREIRLMCSDKPKAQAEFEKFGASGGASRDRLQEAEHAKVAWENVTSFDTYKTYWLTAAAQARQERFHDAEVKKVCEEDKAYLPAVLKKHYWESDLDYLQEAYHKWVESRAYRVFAGHHYRYADIKQEHRDELLEEWQDEMSKLREQEISLDKTEERVDEDVREVRSSLNRGDEVLGEARAAGDAGFESHGTGQTGLDVPVVMEQVESCYAVDLQLPSGTMAPEVSNTKFVEIQNSVARWWNRQNGNSPFGAPMQVLDYPREAEVQRLVESCAEDFQFDLEFSGGYATLESDLAGLWQDRAGDSNSSEQDINRILFDDGMSFDAINRATGADGRDNEEPSKEEIEFERSEWSGRGR